MPSTCCSLRTATRNRVRCWAFLRQGSSPQNCWAAPKRAISALYPSVHGAPVHIGHPQELGITDLDSPDFGDAVDIPAGWTPVFWACGVTPQAAIMESTPELAISHAPGHMLITDLPNSDLQVP